MIFPFREYELRVFFRSFVPLNNDNFNDINDFFINEAFYQQINILIKTHLSDCLFFLNFVIIANQKMMNEYLQ